MGRWAAHPRAEPTRLRLSRFLAQHAGRRMDLDVDFHVSDPASSACASWSYQAARQR
jgi:hypothetical protein